MHKNVSVNIREARPSWIELRPWSRRIGAEATNKYKLAREGINKEKDKILITTQQYLWLLTTRLERVCGCRRSKWWPRGEINCATAQAEPGRDTTKFFFSRIPQEQEQTRVEPTSDIATNNSVKELRAELEALASVAKQTCDRVDSVQSTAREDRRTVTDLRN